MGRGVNVDTHTHSTDWLLHLQGVEGLWTTVQDKIRQQIRQTVHTSSHNNQYIFMPVLYTPDLTRPDGLKLHGTDSHLWVTALSGRPPTCFCCHPILSDPLGVMEVGENLFVLAAFDVE